MIFIMVKKPFRCEPTPLKYFFMLFLVLFAKRFGIMFFFLLLVRVYFLRFYDKMNVFTVLRRSRKKSRSIYNINLSGKQKSFSTSNWKVFCSLLRWKIKFIFQWFWNSSIFQVWREEKKKHFVINLLLFAMRILVFREFNKWTGN
jgi:hypothetical protein